MVLKELIFNSFYLGSGCGGLERTDLHIYNCLNGLIFYSFYFERVWWS